MVACSRCLALLIISTLAAASLANVPDVVRVKNGLLQGVRLSKSRFFKGIPYAEPPIRDLRWRPPQPHGPWDGVWDASDFRESCLQGPFSPPITNTSESCLYLNVYAPLPPADPSIRFPVMVWIHGGSYSGGAANESRLNGTWGVEHFQNVIVVTLNYRLNALGFLGSALLANRSAERSYGNYGILDQRMALQWVSENIEAFGGDPKQVTLYGESAGAGSVAIHLTLNRSWPYFQRAIMESGGFSLWITQDAPSGEQTFQHIARAVGCDTIDCLLQADAHALVNASLSATPRCKQSIAWAPVVDGVEILAAPWVRAQAGHHAPVPIIIGTNSDEGASFIPLSPRASASDFDSWLTQSYGAYAAQLRTLYNPSDYPPLPCCTSYFLAAEHLSGDFSMTCPTRRAARWFSRDQQPTFLYMFTKDPVPLPVAPHACEIPFVFMAKNLLYSPGDVATSAHMSSLWNNFALRANPNPVDAPGLWPAYNATTDTNLFINVELSTGTGLRRAQCDFWDQVQVDRCF